MIKNKTSSIILFILLLIVFSCNGPGQKRPPNIVIIFIDDQGYADLGCYGAEDFETPHIDRMADEGLRFTSFYVSEAVCSASRSSLLTGCYAQRVNIRGALGPNSFSGLHPGETTIASMLRPLGYRTAIYGKWHLGDRLEFLPANFGFDEYYGLPYSNDMWPVGYDGFPSSEGFKAIYPTLCLLEDSICVKEVTTLDDQAQLTTLYTQKAVDFIYRNKDNPFFLYVPHSMVHVPLAVSEKFAGKSVQGMYGDVMEEVDWSVGEILTALEDNGLDDETLVIYTSDNGPWLNFGNHAGSAGPFREGKGTAWEGGVRVPCIMKWPGTISQGRTSAEMATTLDILPTIAKITGATLPEKKIDGMDLSNLLLTDTAASPRDEFWYFYTGGLRAVRKGNFKLMLPHKSRSYEGVEPGKDGFPGPYAYPEVPQALYDLEKDPGERKDVSADHPEVVEQLLAMAEEARKELGDLITDVEGEEVRPCGRIRTTDSILHMARGKRITLASQPVKRYNANGGASLIDGQLGSFDFLDGKWLGFRGEGLDAVIDLGKIETLEEVRVNFLKNQTSWIFLPAGLTITVSSDSIYFEVVHEQTIANTEKDLKVAIEPFGFEGSTKARYIHVKARAIGNCPDWHPGRNALGWLFADEIIVR
jgi:arylsulfatase